MSERLITFQTAKVVKEKGFDIIPDKYWCNYYTGEPLNKWKQLPIEKLSISWMEFPAPTQSQLQQWLRDTHQIEIAVQWFDTCYIKAVNKKPFKANTYRVEGFQSYEEALEIALQEALNLI